MLNSVQTFPLSYQSPLARVSFRILSKVRWNAAWQFYNYSELFRIPIFAYNQNFHANTGYITPASCGHSDTCEAIRLKRRLRPKLTAPQLYRSSTGAVLGHGVPT